MAASTREAFWEEGFCITNDFVSQADLKTLSSIYNDVVRATLDDRGIISVKCKSLLWIKNPEILLGELLTQNEIFRNSRELAAEIFDVSPKNLSLSPRFFYKPSGSRETLLHQEAAYIEDKSSLKLNIWAPLDEADIYSGCMTFVPGSHKDGYKEHVVDSTDDRNITWYIPNIKQEALRSFPMSPGQASAHHNLTIHGATANTSERNRRSLVIICSHEL